MKMRLIEYTPNPEDVCGKAAAVCTRSSNYQKALQHSIASGHESVLEHASFTFKIEGISRVCLAQLTRHRLMSFSVESQRYAKAQDSYRIPDNMEDNPDVHKTMIACDELYYTLLGQGIPAEDARYILPQAVTTDLILTANARELRHFFELRCCNRAQDEIRELADKMLELCMEVAPVIFGDAGPRCVNGKGCRELKPCGRPRGNEE